MVSKEGKCGGIHINLLIGIRQDVKVDVGSGLEVVISTLSYAKEGPNYCYNIILTFATVIYVATWLWWALLQSRVW